MKKLKRNGFTLIEALLALFITSLVSLLGCMLMRCASHFAHMDVDTQNQFAVLQLRSINVNLKMYSFDHLRMYNIDHINTCCSRW